MSGNRQPGGASRPATPPEGSHSDTERLKETFRLVIEGQEMLVTYEPYWSDGEFAVGHFEFRSPFEPRRRIPVSETGYRSHFAAMPDIEACESAELYARLFVEAVLDRGGKAGMQEKQTGQLNLF
jgi:hypothetical protein